MRSYLILLTGLIISNLGFGQVVSFDKAFSTFIDTYEQDGKINYQAIDSITIAQLDQKFATVVGDDYTNSKMGLVTKINAYNYLVVRAIAKAYPIESVAEINGFFKNKIALAKGLLSLDDLEKDILDSANDPFIHLLLNCGAKSCPSIQAIEPNTSLEAYYKLALQEPQVMKVEDDKLWLSQIFFWYQDEFGSREILLAGLEKYAGLKELDELKLEYLDYDWLLNDIFVSNQIYYPTKLYSKGGGELKIFNNYYTQSDAGLRYNFFSSFFQLLIGTNKNLNFGLDIKIRSVNQGNVPLFSALKFQNVTFQTADENQVFSRVGISGIGPKIKYQPFQNWPNINFLHTLYFVPMRSAQGNSNYGYADYNNLQFYNQIYYEKELSVKRRLFMDIGLNIENIKLGVHRNKEHFMPIQLPITAIYSFFPDTKWTLYGLGSFGQRLDVIFAPDQDSYIDYSVYGQLGAGCKYLITEFLELEFLYTNFIDTTPNRQAHTFNLGLRFFRF